MDAVLEDFRPIFVFSEGWKGLIGALFRHFWHIFGQIEAFSEDYWPIFGPFGALEGLSGTLLAYFLGFFGRGGWKGLLGHFEAFLAKLAFSTYFGPI